ncbi:hypothetical protein C1I98_04695 [Spongiactinospora gelatinilytica]|uniref:Arginine/ornithine antiporter ArcD n=1 Tax=Spongiactinospora gelatinilytica TaxID=2666298 RepID=A0A2W2HTX6_9ACTN|nr:hypothetical protein [Spongiactinospora gelatinilytica]PZG54140.1 hypothetical protein C1I98_04695 [Spongiactinospora gelatinilytica]
MDLTSWLITAGLGAFHGLNPAMGWLFAVALGLQERSRAAVLRALPPIVLGHAGLVLLTLTLVAAARTATPPKFVSYGVAGLVCCFGLWRLLRRRHPRWVGMRVTRWQLAGWSFLMAGAHGAGLMLLPVTLRGEDTAVLALTGQALASTAAHTLAMLAVTTGLALLVYDRLGVAVLRKAWFNLDLAWGVALVGAGISAVLV